MNILLNDEAAKNLKKILKEWKLNLSDPIKGKDERGKNVESQLSTCNCLLKLFK